MMYVWVMRVRACSIAHAASSIWEIVHAPVDALTPYNDVSSVHARAQVSARTLPVVFGGLLTPLTVCTVM